MCIACRTDFKVDSILEQVEAEHKKQMCRCIFAVFLVYRYLGVMCILMTVLSLLCF